MEILIPILFIVLGVCIAALVFLFLDRVFRKDHASIRTDITNLQAAGVALKSTVNSNFAFCTKRLEEIKATPTKSAEVNDVMNLFDQKQVELERRVKEIKAQQGEVVDLFCTNKIEIQKMLTDSNRDFWNLTKDTNHRLKVIELRVSDLSPYHKHLHQEFAKAKKHSKPLLPKSDEKLEYTPTMGSEL